MALIGALAILREIDHGFEHLVLELREESRGAARLWGARMLRDVGMWRSPQQELGSQFESRPLHCPSTCFGSAVLSCNMNQ